MNTNIDVQLFADAQSFLHAIEVAAQPYMQVGWHSNWIFRGHANETWPLLPSAWRSPKGASGALLARRTDQYLNTNDDFARWLQTFAPDWNLGSFCRAAASAAAELSLLEDFRAVANEVGHVVPGPTAPDASLVVPWREAVQNFPRVAFYPQPQALFAIAQHHGLPTRLLDWTRNPMVAALFAASGVRDPATSPPFCVWALSTTSLAKNSSDEETAFQLYEVPRALDPYLHAQSGVFVHAPNACRYFAKHGRWPTLADSPTATLRKFALPAQQAGEVLRLLTLNGISMARLMPTFDSIVDTLITTLRWTDPRLSGNDPVA